MPDEWVLKLFTSTCHQRPIIPKLHGGFLYPRSRFCYITLPNLLLSVGWSIARCHFEKRECYDRLLLFVNFNPEITKNNLFSITACTHRRSQIGYGFNDFALTCQLYYLNWSLFFVPLNLLSQPCTVCSRYTFNSC